MFNEKIKGQLTDDLAAIREAGLFKAERIILTPQSTAIGVADGEGAEDLEASSAPLVGNESHGDRRNQKHEAPGHPQEGAPHTRHARPKDIVEPQRKHSDEAKKEREGYPRGELTEGVSKLALGDGQDVAHGSPTLH